MSHSMRSSGHKSESARAVTGSAVLIGVGALVLILVGWVVLQAMGTPSPGSVFQGTIARPPTPTAGLAVQPTAAPSRAEPGASPIPMLPPPATIAQPGPTALSQAPRLTVGELEHDFGDIHPTAPVSHVFVFTNTGTAELVIERLTAS